MGWMTQSKQINISGRPARHTVPNSKKHCTFQNKGIGMFRKNQPIQKSLESITNEQIIERLSRFVSDIKKPLVDGFCDIPFAY
jgi:hypothetical protein